MASDYDLIREHGRDGDLCNLLPRLERSRSRIKASRRDADHEIAPMTVKPTMRVCRQRGGVVAEAIPAEIRSQAPRGMTRF